MARQPTAVEIFYPFSDVIRTKDPGFVMHYLSKQGWNTQIICANQMRKPMKVFRPRINAIGTPFFPKACWRLLKDAKRIDYLVLFHTHPFNPAYSMIFKLRNPKGVVYIKSDMDNTVLKIGNPSLLNYARRIKLLANLLSTDLFSTEQLKVYELLRKRYPRFRHKMFHLPNAYGDYVYVPQTPYGQKEDIILTIGPVGSNQKATDIILKTAERVLPKAKGWRLIMIGKVLDEYKPALEEFFKKNPKLRERIILKGNVTDRKEMLGLYANAKIAFMPSRWETFSCALLEAAHYSNVIIGTSVGGVPELTENGAHGAVCDFEDVDALSKALLKRVNDSKLLEREAILTKRISDKRYNWDSLAAVFARRLIEEKKTKEKESKKKGFKEKGPKERKLRRGTK